jgi:hypothetical protein
MPSALAISIFNIISSLSAPFSSKDTNILEIVEQSFSPEELVALDGYLQRLKQCLALSSLPPLPPSPASAPSSAPPSAPSSTKKLKFKEESKLSLLQATSQPFSTPEEVAQLISELSEQSAFVKGEGAESVEEKVGALVTYYNRITTAITSTTAATFFLHYNIGLICDSILSLYRNKKDSTLVFKTRFDKSY